MSERDAPHARQCELQELLGVVVACHDDRGSRFERALAQLKQLRRCETLHHERHPQWLPSATLCRLRAEAEELWPQASRQQTSWYADVGPAALALVQERAFWTWLLPLCGARWSDLGHVALGYLYYSAGDDFQLHIDNPLTHSLNCLVGLRHWASRDGSRSQLLVFKEPEPVAFDLGEGGVVLFEAESTPHLRTNLGSDELITILSIGVPYRSPSPGCPRQT